MEKKLKKIYEKIFPFLEKEDKVREEGLRSLREITRDSANIIKKIHQGKFEEKELRKTITKLKKIKKKLKEYPELFYQGFLHQTEKEVVEAVATWSIVVKKKIPDLNDFDPVSYLHGLCESLGEIRRYLLDRMREEKTENIEEFLKIMDNIYFFLLNFQFPDAITRNLRRQIDYAKGIIEKTRGEITTFYLLKKKEI